MIEPCTCSGPFPLTTLEGKKMLEKDARRVDAMTPEGRWHCIRIGENGPVHQIQLAQQSAERVAEKQALVAKMEERRLLNVAKIEARKAAMEKLKALGLSDGEIKALFE